MIQELLLNLTGQNRLFHPLVRMDSFGKAFPEMGHAGGFMLGILESWGWPWLRVTFDCLGYGFGVAGLASVLGT